MFEKTLDKLLSQGRVMEIKIRTEDIWMDGEEEFGELTVHSISDTIFEMKKYFEAKLKLVDTQRELDHFGFNFWPEGLDENTFMQVGTVGDDLSDLMIMVQSVQPKKILGFIPSSNWLCETKDSVSLDEASRYVEDFLNACQKGQHLEYILNFS